MRAATNGALKANSNSSAISSRTSSPSRGTSNVANTNFPRPHVLSTKERSSARLSRRPFATALCTISSGTGPTRSLNEASSTIAIVAAKGKGRFSAFGGLPDSCARQVTTFDGIARLDISGFFMNIDRRILYSLVMGTLERYAFAGVPSRNLCLYLLQKVIFDDPLERAVFRSPMSAWGGLPKNKTLRFARPFCGLPIGNLTSQLFGNVYLNPLDQFIKRELKVRYYGRYVDDMVLVYSERAFLLDCIQKIREFLWERLRLRLHPQKIYLQPASRGFPFLGAFILPYRTYLGRSFWKSFRKCLERPASDPLLQLARETSYLGLFKTFYPGKFAKLG